MRVHAHAAICEGCHAWVGVGADWALHFVATLMSLMCVAGRMSLMCVAYGHAWVHGYCVRACDCVKGIDCMSVFDHARV